MSLNGSNLRTFESTATLTRPADTPGAYTDNDAISDSTSAPTALEFTDVGERGQTASDNSQTVMINELIVHLNNLETLTPELRVWFFRSEPTAINDHTAFTLSDSDNLACRTRMKPDGDTGGAINNFMAETNLQNIIFRLGPDTTSIFALAEVLNAYIPIASEVYTFTIKG